jgi:hypothetical protein
MDVTRSVMLLPLLAVLALPACNAGGGGSVPAAPLERSTQADNTDPERIAGVGRRVCPAVQASDARCDALIMRDATNGPAGWMPVGLQRAYNLPSSTRGAGAIVAIVDAYDNPNLVSDLQAYRKEFGLGKARFTKFNQEGQIGNYPQPGKSWGLEEDLDVEMVSAICPKCTIYLIEANSEAPGDLEAAEAESVTLGAQVVSNSWGCAALGCLHGSYFDSSGVVYVASAGDNGYGTQEPAALDTVVAVGGTDLAKQGAHYTESAWRWTGSGCAHSIPKPSWQHDGGCKSRTMSDVSAVARNVAEYDSYGYRGWFTVAGTSISSPLIAGIFALAGNATSLDEPEQFWMLSKKTRSKDLHDIMSGSNGRCRHRYLCKAGPGYDGPTGWGTPNGIGAF